MNNQNTISFIFSGNWKNQIAKNIDISILIQKSHKIHQAEGLFNGIKEQSLIVEGESITESLIKDIAFDIHNQTSYLKVYADNSAYIVESDSDKEFYLGIWQKVEKPYHGEHYTKFLDYKDKEVYYVCR